MTRLLICLIFAVGALVSPMAETAFAETTCRLVCSDDPDVETGDGALIASYFEAHGSVGYASNDAGEAPEYRWRLRTQCEMTDPAIGGCDPSAVICDQPAGRVISYYVVQSQPLVRVDRQPVDGQPPPPAADPGTPYGRWVTVFSGCVDVTDLNPPPSPAEVFRYFQTLPLPQLSVQQQPPGNGLVGLPVIFYTDSPTAQSFTVDIRGFTVVIDAVAEGYTWHTGDGTDLTSDGPGAPYPHQTVTHDYASGSYTVYLTTTWGATFTVDGGAAADVPGTTTTDGPPVSFDVLQARPVLTNPYD